MDFLNIDLDDYVQPADVRLRDDSNSYEIVITQAHFNKTGANICRLRSDQKAKEFVLTTDEMHALATAWTDYQARIVQHAADIEAQKQQTIAEAKALAKSVCFDLDKLNIRAKRDGDDWYLTVSALGYERHTSSVCIKDAVQAAFDHIKEEVERAEKFNCWYLDEWKTIVASYRRAFPLPTEQGEPTEIVQARALLKEAGIDGWVLNLDRTHPEKWILHGSFGQNDELDMYIEPPAQILAIVKEYLERKNEKDVADFWANHQAVSAAGGC